MSTSPQVDPEVMRQIGLCGHDLLPQQGELTLVIHQRLLELIPTISHLPGSGRPMCQRIVTTVLHAADAGRSLERSAAVVQQVGAENFLEGFPTDQYGSVTHALLHGVRGVYRGEWSSGLSSAWVEFLIWFRAALAAGAQAQSAHQAAHQAAQESARLTTPGVPHLDADAFGVPVRPAPEPGLPASVIIDDDLDDEDDDEPGYGSIMTSMTRGGRRDRRGR